MREVNAQLPSREESEKETKKRLEIVGKIKPILETFAEAIILAGSVAYGKNFSVRKESDIDLIILINREDVDKVFESQLFELTPQREEERELFKKNEVDNFNIIKYINDVKIQLHFWDKEAHFKAERFELPAPKIYNIWEKSAPKLTGLDFTGKKRFYKLKHVKKTKYGLVHEYPACFIDEGSFVLRTLFLNLIVCPLILFTKDPELLKNIDKIWENLAKRLIEESTGKIDLNNKSIINSMYGYWNLSPESKQKLEKRQKAELIKLGIPKNQLSL